MNFITEDDIKAQEEKLAALKSAKLAQDNLPLAELAIELHGRFCGYNHTDGCAWGYESRDKHDWSGQAHRRWMERTEVILEKFKTVKIGERVATLGWAAVVPEVIQTFLTIVKETD